AAAHGLASTVPVEPASPAEPQVVSMSIERQALNDALLDFGRLAEQMQVVAAPGGGWRLVRAQEGSLPRRLGLREGDVVRRVADRPLQTFDDAAGVYARLRTSDHVILDLEREGRKVTIFVRIAG